VNEYEQRDAVYEWQWHDQADQQLLRRSCDGLQTEQIDEVSDVGDERPSPSSEERETSASKQQDDGDDACDYEEQHV